MVILSPASIPLIVSSARCSPSKRCYSLPLHLSHPPSIVRAVAGLALALGWLLGYVYSAVPVFGIALCPTAIFMIRILLLASWRVAR
ncbi:hypothetical protein BMJ34_29905 [Sinorhizobium medicae]|uniref:Transmembrane protein n=1 Tax=Sinorhizobium medicae TaxID=110321 RepID=A0ABX4TCG1_9HYPH|nr:hypothetical protein BMJ34_29905 [Sinorhizobium medicae]PLT92972.1 hypothetical protein BMJ33_32530 [Sinorhizobium medicae]PLU35379.1 hypothetical protein BMJ27_13400 [Sinorhizobium medicae]PLU74884.1 hypothetical protein BMJ19_35625 [Sinorhizobium medicae]